MPNANVKEAIERIEAILKKCTTCGGWCDLVKVIKNDNSAVADLLSILALAKRAEELERHVENLTIQLRDAIAFFREGHKTIQNGETLYDAGRIRETYINNYWEKAVDNALVALNTKEPA